MASGSSPPPRPPTCSTTSRASTPAQPRRSNAAAAAGRDPPGYRLSFVPRVVLLPPLQDFKQASIPKHLAPALVEDVTIGLSRLKSVSVIAPHTAWQLDPFTALDEVRAHQIDYAVESRIAPQFLRRRAVARHPPGARRRPRDRLGRQLRLLGH